MEKNILPVILKLPRPALRAQSFAIDFGGSVIKVAYKVKGADSDNEDAVSVRLASFSRKELPLALEFIRANCDFPSAATQYNMTGIGTHEFEKTMARELNNISVNTLWEGACLIRGLRHILQHVPPKDLFHEPLATMEEERLKTLVDGFKQLVAEIGEKYAGQEDATMKSLQARQQAEEGLDEPGKTDGPVSQLPCIYCSLGSAFAFKEVKEDGEGISAFTPRAGRMFLGLGALLTGAKTFEELIDLAERGDDRKLNCYLNDVTKSSEATQDGGGNAGYKAMAIDVQAFAFGWAVGKNLSDFKREDLARALLVNICDDVTGTCLELAIRTKQTNIVLGGSFIQAPLTRKILEERFLERYEIFCIRSPPGGQKKITMRMLKSGSHLGAIGAMLEGN